jgi:hypothetical protein
MKNAIIMVLFLVFGCASAPILPLLLPAATVAPESVPCDGTNSATNGFCGCDVVAAKPAPEVIPFPTGPVDVSSAVDDATSDREEALRAERGF